MTDHDHFDGRCPSCGSECSCTLSSRVIELESVGASLGVAAAGEVARLRADLEAATRERDDYKRHFEACDRARRILLENRFRVRAALEGTPENVRALAVVLAVSFYGEDMSTDPADGWDDDARCALTALRERCFGAESKEESGG